MRCSRDRWMTGCSLTLFACLVLTTAGCSKPAQDAPPTESGQPGAAVQPATNAAAAADAAPGQPAAAAAAAPAGSAAQPAANAAPATAGPAPEAAPPPPPPPPAPRTFTLAEGTVLSVTTSSALSTNSQSAGERFEASLAEPIVEGDWVVARKGAPVEGLVVSSTKGGRVKGTAQLEVALTGLTLTDGQRIRLETAMATAAAKSEKKKDVGKVAITTGAGALIGGIAGGGKGAAIGAAVGGAGGTAVVLGTRGGPAVIPAGTQMRFRVKTPVEITEKK